MATLVIGSLVVVAMVVFAGLLVINGMQALQRNEGLGWHAVGMAEVVAGLLDPQSFSITILEAEGATWCALNRWWRWSSFVKAVD